MATHIKLCGMMRPEDIETANALGPDFIGFVFAKKSKRAVTPDQAAALKAALDHKIKAVGVFVDEDPAVIAKLFADGVIDAAQLHGSETDDVVAQVKALTGGNCPVIQAVAMRGAGDIPRAAASPADHILLDAKGGGTGHPFNWDLAKAVSRPYLLAGGLSPDNIAEALVTLHPWGVDVSSGIETDGRKDSEKMRRFVEQVRRFDANISNI
ncbi:phosphoribosylanthranilate isomerase [uncultured Pseudoramibacter sp.]|uniref:phosphoribosylanthranilate isomerase n=1 Tax=uncultured Pseudoramibacter sp. TaxID=1623493 RepID=UPI0025D8FA54|nr:phosphoribosylanthranilate isomerase [uncultured Pseudoramibacter sp.]